MPPDATTLKRSTGLLGLAILLLALEGCSTSPGDPPGPDTTDMTTAPSPATCDDEDRIEGSCVGVTRSALCQDEFCDDGQACSEVFEIRDDAELKVLIGVQPGDCVMLAQGEYGELYIPPGASVLGTGEGSTTTGEIIVSADAVGGGEITVPADAQSRVRGVTVLGAGIRVEHEFPITISHVRVSGAADTGIYAEAGTTITLLDSTIEDAVNYGLLALDARSVTVERSLVQRNGAGGVAVACPACPAAARTDLQALNLLVRDSGGYGLLIQGSAATVESGLVLRTDLDPLYLGGGGVAVIGGATLNAMGLSVADSVSVGVVIDDAEVTLGPSPGGTLMTVSNNEIGISISNFNGLPEVPAVTLTGVQVDDNLAVGISLSDPGVNVTIENDCAVRGTRQIRVPAFDESGLGGESEVGDGLSWIQGAQAQIIGLTLAGNQRQSLIIDGPVGLSSSISGLQLEDGDETKGVVIQRVDAGSVQPEVKGTELRVSAQPVPVAVPPPPPVGFEGGGGI